MILRSSMKRLEPIEHQDKFDRLRSQLYGLPCLTFYKHVEFNLSTAFGNAVAISQSSGHQLIGKQTYDSMRAAEKNSERFAKLFKGSIDKILIGSSHRERDAVCQRQIERTDVSLKRFFPALLVYVRC